MEFFFLFLFLVFAFIWKNGWLELWLAFAVRHSGRFASWSLDFEGRGGGLVDKIGYRDFYTTSDGFGVVETRGGYIWAGFEGSPLGTDDWEPAIWNQFNDVMSAVASSLPGETYVQCLYHSAADAGQLSQVWDRQEKVSLPGLRLLTDARRIWSQKEVAAGHLTTPRLLILIGCKKEQLLNVRIPLLQTRSSEKFIDLSARAFAEQLSNLLRTLQSVEGTLSSYGGVLQPASAARIWQMCYERLNPERALQHPAPEYAYADLAGVLPVAEGPEVIWETTQVATDGKSDAFWNTLDVLNIKTRKRGEKEEDKKGAQGGGKTDDKTAGESDGLRVSQTNVGWYASSPRELLVMSDISLNRQGLKIGDTYVGVLSLSKLPERIWSGAIQTITRNARINFPFSLSVSLCTTPRLQGDAQIEEEIKSLEKQRSLTEPERRRLIELHNLQEQMGSGEVAGVATIQFMFRGETEQELLDRRDLLIALWRQLADCQMLQEQAAPLEEYLGGLPALAFSAVRKRRLSARDGMALMPWVGGVNGVPPAEAIMVLRAVDNSAFFWNPSAPSFKTGMSIISGVSRSGKSAWSNYQLMTLLQSGKRGVLADFGGGGSRVGALFGAEYIDVTRPESMSTLGLFDIGVRSHEYFSPAELSETGVPLVRMSTVVEMIRALAGWAGAHKKDMDPRDTFLNMVVSRTYYRLRPVMPILSDFVETARLLPNEYHEQARDFITRLSIYVQDQMLAGIFESREAKLHEARYVIFDFKGAENNPRLRLVGSLGVLRQLEMLPKVSPHGFFFAIDEFGVVAQEPLIFAAAELSYRTAAKLGGQCTLISQSPGDFLLRQNGQVVSRRLVDDSEVVWLFQQSVPLATDLFDLNPGEQRLLEAVGQVQSNDFRDAVVLYPSASGRRAALVRISLGPLDGRLCLGSTSRTENFSVEEALAEIGLTINNAPPALIAALSTDGLGRRNTLTLK